MHGLLPLATNGCLPPLAGSLLSQRRVPPMCYLNKWPPLSMNDFLPQWISSLNELSSPWTTSVLPQQLVSCWRMISELDKLSPSSMQHCLLPWWTASSWSPPVCYVAPPSFNDWSLSLPPTLMIGLLPHPTSTNGLILPSANNLLSWWVTSSSHTKMLLEVCDQEMRIRTSGGWFKLYIWQSVGLVNIWFDISVVWGCGEKYMTNIHHSNDLSMTGMRLLYDYSITSTHRTHYRPKVLHMVNCPMYHRATPMGPIIPIHQWT